MSYFKADRREIKRALRKRKEKKEKKTKEYFELVSRRANKKNPPSDIQKYSNILTREGAEDALSITAYLRTNLRKDVSTEQAKLFQVIVQSHVANGNIRVTDKLANNPCYTYYSLFAQEGKCITNDALYLTSLMRTDAIGRYKDNNILPLISESDPVEVSISSIPKIFGEKKEQQIYSGYYQDYDGNFCCLGPNALSTYADKSADELAIFINNKQNKTDAFLYNGKKYIGFGNKELYFVVLADEIDTIDYKKKLEELKRFQFRDDKCKLTPKKSKVLYKTRFMQCTVKVDQFCPAFVIFPEVVTFNLLYKVKLDYNKVFDHLDKYSDTQQLALPANFVYWDTIPYCFDFIMVYTFTSQKIKKDLKDRLTSMLDTYANLKPIIMLWKTQQLKIQSIIVEYFNSFTTGVRFDKFKTLYDKLVDYNKTVKMYYDNPSYSRIHAFFNNTVFGFGDMMIKGQLRQTVFLVFKQLELLIKDLVVNMKINKDWKEEMHKMSTILYYLGFAPEQKAESVFPINLSPGGFLGDILGEAEVLENADPLKEFGDKYLMAASKMYEAQATEFRDLMSAFDESAKIRPIVIKNTVAEMNTKGNYNLAPEVTTKIEEMILSSYLSGQTKYKDMIRAIDKAVAEYMTNEKDNPTFDTAFIKGIFDAMKSIEDRKMQEIQNRQNEIERQQQELDALKQQQMNELDPYALLQKKRYDNADSITTFLEILSEWKNGGSKYKEAYAKYYQPVNAWLLQILHEFGLNEITTDEQAKVFIEGNDPLDLIRKYQQVLVPAIVEIAVVDKKMPNAKTVLTNGYGLQKGMYTRVNEPKAYSDQKWVDQRLSMIKNKDYSKLPYGNVQPVSPLSTTYSPQQSN